MASMDRSFTVAALRAAKLEKADAAERVTQENKGRLVRLYRRATESWNLQLFAPLGVGYGGARDGKDFIIASATLDRDGLMALRHFIDEALASEPTDA